MNNNTWHSTAIAPAFGMPAFGPASRAALALGCATPAAIAMKTKAVVCADARVTRAYRGTSAWSPPLS